MNIADTTQVDAQCVCSNFGPKGEERQQPHVVLHLRHRDVGLRVEGFQNQVFVGRAAAEPHVVRHLLGIWLRVQG